ncbi:Serpentine Receptor, class TX [Ditylenchus destructor]|nr:Serpentine Receptor, class TX [Ditylenchus destructor]
MSGTLNRMNTPDFVYKILPVFGFLLFTSSSIYVVVMRKQKGGILMAVYYMQCLDVLLGLSLFYMGFHGVFIGVYSDESDEVQPFTCLFTALHLHIWCFVDAAGVALLSIMCFDQVISVIWSKTHKGISEYYSQVPCICFILVLSSGVFVPAWMEPIKLSNNSTITISPFCMFDDVVGSEFYDMDLAIRKLSPIIEIAILAFAGFSLLVLQLSQSWSFKWSDNNRDSSKFYYYTLIRCILLLVSMYMPLGMFAWSSEPAVPGREFRDGSKEIALRVSQAVFLGLLQPLNNLFVLPRFRSQLLEFCGAKEHARTWQSADDPPAMKTIEGKDGLYFGSWYSTAGNIIGEAGVPYELDAEKQRSVSFFYEKESGT